MMFKRQTTKPQAGFTLIEAFIAISILLIAIVGPMSLISQSISDANYAANQITAFYLAQEGLELVINQRELNGGLSKDRWLDGLSGCTDGQACEVSLDPSLDLSIKPCNGDCTDTLFIDQDGVYNYETSGTPTTYVRTIKITPDPQAISVKDSNGNAQPLTIDVKVDSTVSWQDKGVARSFTLSTILTD